MAATVSAGLTPRAGRRFAFSVGIAFLVLAALTRWRGREAAPLVLGAAGAALLLAGTFVPGRLGPLYRAWMAVGRGLSKVTTPIILGIVYFIVLTPTRLVLRLFGHQPLRQREREGSYWTRVESDGRSDLENQF